MHPDAPYRIEAADCLACETALKGSVDITAEDAAAHPEWMCDAGTMTWDLTIDKQIAFNVGYGASKPLRDAEAFAMYWHAEGMKTPTAEPFFTTAGSTPSHRSAAMATPIRTGAGISPHPGSGCPPTA